MGRVRLFLYLWAALTAVPARGLDPSRPVSQYSQMIWRVPDGLPDNFVQALVQTRDGYLWLGTTEGLVRFDGMQFTVFDTRNTAALRHNSVVTLCEDRRGALWVGTSGGGIAVYRDGRFVATYDTSNGLPNNYIRSIYEDREGNLWITAHAGGLVRLRDGRFQVYTTRDGLPSDSLRTIYQDSSGALWIGTDEDGICVMRGGAIQCFDRSSGLRSNQIRAFYEDRRGRLWVGTRAGGLHWFDGRRFHPVAVTSSVPAGAVRAVLEDRKGNLWIGTEGAGLLRLRGARSERLTPREGLPHSFVRAILEDREGNLWVGTRGGLLRLRDKKAETWTTTEGLVNDDVRALLAEPCGRVWIGTRAGLNFVENGRVRTVILSREWSRDVVRTLARTGDGTIWIGADTGLFRYKEGTVNRIAVPGAGREISVRCLLADSRGRLWIGTWDRLLVLEGSGFSDHSRRLGGQAGGVNVLAEDRSGDLWIGTTNGLLRLSGDAVRRFTSAEGLANDHITSLHMGADGVLWIGTRGGLCRYAEGRFAVFRRKDGLLSDNILAIAEDRSGHLWLTSRRGIARIHKRELEEFAAGRKVELQAVTFDTADGMKSAQCNGDAQPAATMTADGRMWFPTVAGVVVFDPANLQGAPSPPRVVIEKILAGWRSWAASTAEIRLGAGINDLEILFTAISLSAPERVRFRHRLEGYDSEWIEAGRRRTARYTNIPPGRYRFRVVAYANDGSWPREEAGVDLVLEPRFYQTGWFLLLCGLALLGVVGAGYRARMMSLRRRFEAVLEERARIAREIHDTLMQGVTGVSLQLEAASRRLPWQPEEAKQRMDRALEKLDEVVAEARRTILDLRGGGLVDLDIEASLREVVRRLSLEHGICTDFRVEGPRRALPPAVTTHLVGIAREAASNAIRHSGASRLSVWLKFENGKVRLRAADDGRGFDPSNEAKGCFGLTGMRERAAALGGRLLIRSAPGAGTEVEVEVPLGSRF